MINTRNTNWAIIQEQFDVYASNVHILRDCDQLLFANQQLNFNFDTVSSLLAMIHASVKSYRSACFAFRRNLLNSNLTLLQGCLPMSLIPMNSLLAILNSVAFQQAKAADRVSLALPTSDLLSYYYYRLLADAVTISEGLFCPLKYRWRRNKRSLFFMKQKIFLCPLLMIPIWLLHGSLRPHI